VTDELDWRDVRSSNIAAVAFAESGVNEYGQEVGDLFVRFHSGRAYRYVGVLAEHRDRLLAADEERELSVGRVFHRTIRSTYAAERIDEEEDGGEHEDPDA
jgi:KTSC domain